MRLIDADRLLKPSFTDMFDKPVKMDMFSRYAIESQPTVEAIPLNKPFCKMVYGDYVCYNRNWLMKHLPMELDILQGKAIPIEWIEKWLDKTTGTRDGEDISQLPEQLKIAIQMINLMEMEWGKENETN